MKADIRKLGDFSCNLPGGKLPCELLEVPRNEEACQLAQRMERLFKYASSQCDTAFGRKYETVLDDLITNSRPVAYDCKSPGEPMDRFVMKQMSQLYEEEFGLDYREASRNSMEASRVMRIERNRQRKRIKVQEKNAKFERSLQQAALRLEAHQQKLREFKLENSNMQNDVFTFEEEEVEEHIPGICTLDKRSSSEYLTQVENKYTRRLITLDITQEDFDNLSDAFSLVIQFILTERAEDCGEIQFSCEALDQLFADEEDEDLSVYDMIDAAHLLVEMIEEQCSSDNFSVYVMSLQGKYDRL